jgi:cytochrome c oxidase assembly factor CtaG/polyferredoxin
VDPITEAVLKSWNLDTWALAAMLLTVVIYVRGWRELRQQPRYDLSRLVSFVAGLAVVFAALFSPLDAFSNLLLTAHMVQHLLLMMVAPPLILYGAPYLPLLRGLPRSVLKHGVGPFLTWPALQQAGRWLTHPLVCLFTFLTASVTWHLPRFYELALRSPGWHEIEHLCFLGTALLFWWPILQPWPSKTQWPRWALIPYLFLADLQNTALSAFFVFSDRALYPTYVAAPRLFGLSALEDQATAGAIMWVPGSIAYLVPVGLLTVQLLSSRQLSVQPSNLLHSTNVAPLARRKLRRTELDLLSFPLLGTILRWRYFRRAAQTVMFALALLVVGDGLFGHQMAPMNLAGVLPWTHWRGLLVIMLLAAGNFFCLACPFMLTRDVGRRVLLARWHWPARLRSKWLAVGLLALYLWAYEVFRLWDSPWWTAWIAVGYFVTAFLVDGLFQGASFCKYVCPIGQFNFVQSLVSPFEVKARSVQVCQTCTTHDCVHGNNSERGCELRLFVPTKSGNLDCTLCLDCIHACPHENIGIIATAPGSQITQIPSHSLMGRLSKRRDVAALVLLLVFGAFVNAAGMIAPVTAWAEVLQHQTGLSSILPVITGMLVLGLLVLPVLLAGLCGAMSKFLVGRREQMKNLIGSFVLALVPLGFSMWLAHLVYHLLTSAQTIVPVTQRVATDVGIHLLGAPDWSTAFMFVPPDWLLTLQILLLDLGLLLTLYATWRIALRFTSRAAGALALLGPWAGLALSLYSIGVWIVFQPMQMRGMMM